jgi:hypothetical protein
VQAMVHAYPSATVDEVTSYLVTAMSSAQRAEIRRLVVMAVAMERMIASSLHHLIDTAMAGDPTGNAALSQLVYWLDQMQARP